MNLWIRIYEKEACGVLQTIQMFKLGLSLFSYFSHDAKLR